MPEGDIRCQPDDFGVTELLSFEPDGDGAHDYLWVEKTSSNTSWVATQLAEYAGVAPRDVGFAGLKDRHAVTRQWFSVLRRSGKAVHWDGFDARGIRLVAVTRHGKKLRRGAHRGNEFHIVIRNINKIGSELYRKLEQLKALGIANYFGEQRFGRDGANLDAARQLFAGRRLRRTARSLALSAARAYLFNRVLERRVREGSWNKLCDGDCAMLDGSNSFFRVEQVDEVLRDRCARLDLHPSGPLWGAGAPVCGPAVASLEAQVAAQNPDIRDGLDREAKSARRALRARVSCLEWHRDGNVLELGFGLPRGSYATTLLRELVAYRDASRQG
ncbi:MAG: tRNA pseudouridine(13) synthase TruD [Gammaproteobacteria bacterium]|nr:tRNA pseudouridine(13) synthase TruD [Gammaproteobacteria bacterium]